MTQHTASYVPNLDTDAFVSNLSNEVASGSGYTQGGIVLGGKAAAYTPANSWAQQWQANTAYITGQYVRPTTGNGLIFRCVAAGTTGSGQPTWPSEGLTVADGGVTWLAAGPGAVQLTAANVQWLSYSGTFRYLVLSDRTTGSPSTQPLLAIADMGTPTTGTGGNFDVNFDPSGTLVFSPK